MPRSEDPNPSSSLPGISRRGALIALALPVLPGCLRIVPHRAERTGGALLVSAEAAAGLRGPTDVLAVQTDHRTLYLRRLPDGSLAALSNLCTHRSCEVSAEADGYVCPCHGSRFDLWGQVVDGPAERPLLRHEIVTVNTGFRIDGV